MKPYYISGFLMALSSLKLLDFISLGCGLCQIYSIINSLTLSNLFLIPEQKNTWFTKWHFFLLRVCIEHLQYASAVLSTLQIFTYLKLITTFGVATIIFTLLMGTEVQRGLSDSFMATELIGGRVSASCNLSQSQCC